MEMYKSPIENYDQSILVVDDDQEYLDYMETALKSAGYQPIMVASARAALKALEKSRYALMITDLFMPGMTGFELLATVRTIDPLMVGVIMTAFGSVDSAIDAVRGGAYDYLFKPSSIDVILVATRRALEHHVLRQSLIRQATQLETVKLNYNKTVRLLQDVSHKLRNPLAAVYGYSSYLSDLSKAPPSEMGPEALKMSIGSIQENAKRMSNILDELEDPSLGMTEDDPA